MRIPWHTKYVTSHRYCQYYHISYNIHHDLDAAPEININMNDNHNNIWGVLFSLSIKKISKAQYYKIMKNYER